MGFLDSDARQCFEEGKPQALGADIRVISGCEDSQYSADVQDVSTFQLPDPAGRGGGAITSALLNVLYKDNETPEEELTFVDVFGKVKEMLAEEGYEQIPQLTASQPIEVSEKFDLVPESATGTRRAILVGINYVGTESELGGCQNDVGNMKNYIMNVHGFEEENITVLMDDGENTEPTKENMLDAFNKIVEESSADDAIFLHYSGHGTKIHDDDKNEEADGFDEALCPVDCDSNGFILDDDLYDIFVKRLPEGVHFVCVMDCCHSGTVMDLPYVYMADGEFEQMEIKSDFDFQKLSNKIGEFDFEQFLES